MKKNLLAASLALALGTMAGTASAALSVNHGGIGHLNIVPYYSVQDGSNTLLSITNTDTVNGKIVKVRFRAAEWSDDALDFQVFMSPGDVWTAAFGMVDGQLKLVTSDNSCTLPANINGITFATTRVEGREVARLREGYVEIFDVADIRKLAVLNSDYVNSNVTNPLFTAIKHVNGVAPCAANEQLLTGLVEDSTRAQGLTQWQGSGSSGAGVPIDFNASPSTVPTSANYIGNPEWQRSWMAPPTGGLTTTATVISVGESKAFTVPTVAISGSTFADPLKGDKAGATISTGISADYAVVQYFRQANAPVGGLDNDGTADLVMPALSGGVNLGDLTADRLFWPVGFDSVSILNDRTNKQGVKYTMYQFDLPDVSTPFWNTEAGGVDSNNAFTTSVAVGSDHLAELWRDQIASLLRKTLVISDYEISTSVLASTDIVLSQPVRRYYYSYLNIDKANPVFGSDYNRTITSSETGIVGLTDKWKVGGLTGTTYEPLEIGNTLKIAGPRFWDREEQTPLSSSDVTQSPVEPGVVAAIRLKGETSVVSIKHGEGVTGALGASLTAVDWNFSPSYTSGWVEITPKVDANSYAAGSTDGSGNSPNNDFLRNSTNLPVVGFTAINVFNAGAGTNGTNYGLGMPLRYAE